MSSIEDLSTSTVCRLLTASRDHDRSAGLWHGPLLSLGVARFMFVSAISPVGNMPQAGLFYIQPSFMHMPYKDALPNQDWSSRTLMASLTIRVK